MVDHGPGASGVPDSLSVGNLEAIINGSNRAHHEAAGIKHVSQLAPRGSYSRRPMALMDTFHTNPQLVENFKYNASISEQFYSEINATILADAYVSGQGTVVTRNGLLVQESALEYLAHNQVPDGFRRDQSGQGFIFSHQPGKVIEEPSILVKRPWYRNYGHWLVDGATILAHFAEQIITTPLTVVIGANESPLQRNIVRETIDKICPGARVIEMPDTATWRFANLLYVTPLHRPPMVKWPLAMAKLKAAFVEKGTQAVQGQRLYLSRADADTRKLANEDELKGLLDQYGFRTVFTSGMSLTEQARLFGSAEVAMGVKGAALANLVFCQPEATAICLSPGDFIDPFFWDVAGQLGMAYAEIFGRVVTNHPIGRNDFVMEPQRLEWALTTLFG
ncbi:glycosyltransferase family 61 protein [Nitrospirillum sp. BR 11828]|uniref:glycosyltransferase family 61 protein n=1 Tax=Nitrospirillum sp. BR 11828 TaxID=3104325 RepID=UPI002ACA3427|nr:glycosyltransferase 61 family protein [Nitrospirillum sp. BR 11828]MDZ5645637.1 glycosyltransferase 61 family protein [Nitrospirillum sp. BR 11828]